MAFLLDGSVLARPSRAGRRARLSVNGLQPYWLRIAALTVNLALWTLIVLAVRRLVR